MPARRLLNLTACLNESAAAAYGGHDTNEPVRLFRTEPLPGTLRPINVAYNELTYSLEHVSPSGENPRIALYHASVSGRTCPRGTPWCASFVHFCVQQAGLEGTGSMMARSWHDAAWGKEVSPEDALEGDIVVFAKPGRIYGHVAFYAEGNANGATCIGGNQLHRVGKRHYDFNNPILRLLSIRRPPSA